MKEARKPKRVRLWPELSRTATLLVGCLLIGGGAWPLQAQSVHASVWSAALDHSLESALVFQSQSRKETEATIHVYDDILAQQIVHIGIDAPSKTQTAKDNTDAPPSMDQQADTLIVNPVRTGAVNITSASGENIDFLLITQLSTTVKPMAYRLASEVTGTHDIESLAFRNPEGTYVLFTVNHRESPVSFRASWKDRLFPFTQAGNSVAVFAWDPKSQLVSLVAREQRTSADNNLSLEARCSQISPLGIDLRCKSSSGSCSVFPVYFTCDSHQSTVPLTVTVMPATGNDIDDSKPISITITAAPDVGENTYLHVSSESHGR